MKPIRIFLCDDQALFRDGLRMLLSLHPDLDVVGEAENGVEAVQSVINLKDIPADQLADAIRTARQGGASLEPSVASRVVTEFTRLSGMPDRRSEIEALQFSARELDVLRHVSRGRTNKEIATALHISEGTVKNHLTSVFSQLMVQDRTQAALKARELGIT